MDASLAAKASGSGDIADWAKAFLDARQFNGDSAPEGFYTIQELADKLDCTRSVAFLQIQELVKDGKVDVQEFYHGRGKDGRRYKAKHYRIIK